MARRSPASPENSEFLTRRAIVDPKLVTAGWKVCAYDPSKPLATYHACALVEYPTDNGPADYALCSNGRIVGIVEAKKLSLGPQNVLTQALRYAQGASSNPFFPLAPAMFPFLYSTNGELIWHHDIRHPDNCSRQITAFHTPEGLEEKLERNLDVACGVLKLLANDHQRLRPYQQECNAAIEQAIAERKHQMLIAMATGAGKSFTMVIKI